ncbi:MAG: glycine cleavage system aminomethyltransferase GcvT [Acholeplasmataceae bacterium]|nr:glycine cleavage system aminomethyltransferase GcvT [Acholeplasmataceae bacterium]
MKKTSLYENHLKLNAKMIEYAGYLMPVYYQGIQAEHQSVRTHMGVFDVSHMGEFLIEGKDALAFVNYLVTNTIIDDLSKVTYALLLNDEGYPLDDLLVYVIGSEKVLLVVNAGNREKDYAWVLKQIESFDCSARDISDDFSQLALQGPLVNENIDKLLDTTVSDLSFMHYKVVPYMDGHVIISRTGYTGEDGFEVYGHHDFIIKLWQDALDQGVIPCGLGSRDTLRFQANLPLYGQEISESITPYEAGLGFAIKLDKDNFIGKDACIINKENKSRKLVGFELLEKNIPRHGYEVYKDDQQIGHVTTGYMLAHVDKPIGLALIDKAHGALDNEIFIKIRNKMVPAKIRNKKFYTKNYKK